MSDCPDEIAPVAHLSYVPIYVLAGLVVLLTVYELMAPRWGLPTITQWFDRKFGQTHRHWWKILGAAIVGTAVWHMLFGGPL